MRTLLFLIVFAGCKQKQKSEEVTPWGTIYILSENNAVITLNNTNDSTMVVDRHVGSFFSRPKKITVDTVKVYFTEAEKDTIFRLSKQIIAAPVNNFNHCTEFVGSLRIYINYGLFKQQGEYSGVCDWNNLSPETVHLHQILRRKIKAVYLGERKHTR